MSLIYVTRPKKTTRQQIVDAFIKTTSHWYESPKNGFHGQEQQIRAYFMIWAETGEYGPDYDDNSLIYAGMKFREFLESAYILIEDEQPGKT